MIFCEPQDVNAVWRLVAKATANNELGRAAKVAPDAGDGRDVRLICVYTENFADLKDVTRVAANLKELGVIGSRGIYYKCSESSHPAERYDTNEHQMHTHTLDLDLGTSTISRHLCIIQQIS
jgi:hypothetical protein